MNAVKKGAASVRANGTYRTPSTPLNPTFSVERIRELTTELEVPFSGSLIGWQVIAINQGKNRGKIVPFADQRAYTDRLNDLFTPAGWTRKYSVTTSANFERRRDRKLVAKVFVTCDLTIHGIGSHSATREEWADNENAGTSAEAQAFKRACSCFGLGRYLYYFGDIWASLDQRQRPSETPKLLAWATPEGWRQGLRPTDIDQSASSNPAKHNARTADLVRKIEAMSGHLGRRLYRGVLKTVANVWDARQVQDPAVLQKVLLSMQSGERGLERLRAARRSHGDEILMPVLRTLKLSSVEEINSLPVLCTVVSALEERAEQARSA